MPSDDHELTEAEIDALMAARAPLEARPERIPAAEDLQKIKDLFAVVDFMHDSVRSAWGMSWTEVELTMASLAQLRDWALSDPPIHKNYRYRIDTPMDPGTKAPDHLPEGWES